MTLGKGRVDLEVARRFLLELKVTLPTEKNVRKDRRQLLRYLTTYQEQELQIERAALVYFANNEVRVVEVSTAPRARNTFV
jgi:CRISPR/Cas system-associated exonuclease Cas4 (RecB family)